MNQVNMSLIDGLNSTSVEHAKSVMNDMEKKITSLELDSTDVAYAKAVTNEMKQEITLLDKFLVDRKNAFLHKIIENSGLDSKAVAYAKSVLHENGYFSIDTVKTITAQQWEDMGLGTLAFPILLTVAAVSQR